MRVTPWLGVGVVAGIVALRLASALGGYDVVGDVDVTRASLAPSGAHWLGTDHLGRDIAWRLATASRNFVDAGLLACALAAGLGVPAGALAGYVGGWLEQGIQYGFTVVSAIPRFVLVLLLCTITEASPQVLALGAGLAYAPTLGDAVFSRVAELRRQEFVLASRAYGVGHWRLLWVHLVWGACGRLIGRHLLSLFGFFLVLETTLAYLGGFGVQEPTPSWGNMLAFEWGQSPDNPWGVWAPALVTWLAVAGATWAGELVGEER